MSTALKQEKIEAEAQHALNGTGTKINAWASPGPTAFDFRSEPPFPMHSMAILTAMQVTQ